MKNTPPLRFLNGLKIGLDELQFGQAEQDEAARAWRRATMITPGLVIARLPDGSLDDNWRLDDDDDDGSLSLRVGASFGAWPQYAALVDDDGALLVIDRDYVEELTLPDDATWHTVTVRAELTLYEEGRLVLTAGSANITGIGTKFTKYAGYTTDGFARGTRLRIDVADSASGNEGTYELDTVVSDTVATLRTAIPGGSETIARFTVSGDFIGAVPASPDIHYRRRLVLERQTGIVREPAAGTIPLFDVKRDDGGSPRVTFIDRRRQRLYRSALARGGRDADTIAVSLPLGVTLSGASLATATLYVPKNGVRTGATDVVRNAVAPSGDHDTLVLSEDGGTVYAYVDNQHQATATAGSFAGNAPSVCRLPPGSGATHVAAFVASSVLYVRQTVDNGATWAGAVLALDPTAVDAADTCTNPSVILLANNRLLVAVEYFDDSLGYSVIRAVFSDDYGATWDDNGGVGYDVIDRSAATTDVGSPSLGQAPDGTIWIAHTHGTTVGLAYSQDLEGTFTDGPTTTSTAILETYLVFSAHNSPALWVSPTGQLVIFYHGYQSVGTNSFLYYAVVGFQEGAPYLLNQEHLITLDSALASADDLGLAVCQDSSGRLALAFIDTASSPRDSYLIRLHPVVHPIATVGAQGYLAP